MSSEVVITTLVSSSGSYAWTSTYAYPGKELSSEINFDKSCIRVRLRPSNGGNLKKDVSRAHGSFHSARPKNGIGSLASAARVARLGQAQQIGRGFNVVTLPWGRADLLRVSGLKALVFRSEGRIAGKEREATRRACRRAFST